MKEVTKLELVDESTRADVADFLHSRWYTTEELARIIGVDPSSLRRWRTMHPIQGPPFVRLTAQVVKYNADDVSRWLERRRVDPGEAA